MAYKLKTSDLWILDISCMNAKYDKELFVKYLELKGVKDATSHNGV